MKRWLAVAVLVALAVAGCANRAETGTPTTTVGTSAPFEDFEFDAASPAGLPVPVLLCFEGAFATDVASALASGPGATSRCNLEMTPDSERQGNEVTIAVNPTDPRNIVGGAKDYFPTDAGECVWDGVYVTHDGGRTYYEDRSFDGSPWRLLKDPNTYQPNYASQFWCTTDPVAYFDVNGNLYYVLMAYQADRVTGSKTCEDICPMGALNDWAFNRAVQIVAISDNGGDSFHTFTPVLEGSFPVDFHDKAWLAASADGTIHIMWLASLAPGNLYCRSTDAGATFLCDEILGTIVAIPGVTPSSGQGSFLEVGTGPDVYATWDSGGVMFRHSSDTGATWGPGRIIQGINDGTMPGLESRDRRGGFPALGSDRNPDSPFADSLYVTWQDGCQADTWSAGCSSNGSAQWAIASHDKGETWSTPVRLSFASDNEWNIFPTVSVSPGGVVDASWMSTHGTRSLPCSAEATPDCAANYGTEYPTLTQHYAYSLDGGATWSEPFVVRDAIDGGWDPSLCHHQNGMVFIGDYNDIDSSWQAAHPVWPDTRLGTCDVFTATIQRPLFADGWSAEGREAGLAFVRDHPL